VRGFYIDLELKNGSDSFTEASFDFSSREEAYMSSVFAKTIAEWSFKKIGNAKMSWKFVSNEMSIPAGEERF